VESVSHDCIVAEETFRALNGPIEVNRHVLVLFRVQANDFRHADLRRYLAALTGRSENQITQAAISYQLRAFASTA
jgi:hypothetical protein